MNLCSDKHVIVSVALLAEPRSDLNMEVELGFPAMTWTVFCFSGFQQLVFRVDSVFVALSRTAADRANCGVHKLLRTGGVHTI